MQTKQWSSYQNIVIVPVFVVGIFLFSNVSTTEATSSSVKIINEEGDVLKNLTPLAKAVQTGGSVAVGDLGGDGVDEIVVGAGSGSKISIFRQDGSLIRSFRAYGAGVDEGVNVSVGDLDGNEADEIITAPAGDGSPQIRTFDGGGNPVFTPGFFAYAKSFHGGVNVAVGDLDGDGAAEIVTTPATDGGPQVRLFDRYGNPKSSFWAFEQSFHGGVSLSTGNVDGEEGDEIITGRHASGDPEVRVYDASGESLSAFFAFEKDFPGGVNVSTADITGDGIEEVVATPSSRGGAQVRMFSMDGILRSQTTIASKFRGGINASAIDFSEGEDGEEILAAMNPDPTRGGTKRIEVDISDQTLKYYEGDTLIGTHRISSGTWSMPTPIGTHQVRNHLRTAYSKKYALYMDWWMAITPDGAYGIHSLPYWKTKNGIIYEGRNHIGYRVSHGCIRQLPEESKKLYQWAPNGTKVAIHQ